MPAVLPTLVANAHTRVGAEASIYYNLGQAVVLGSIAVTDPGVATYANQLSCSDSFTCPVSGFVAIRAALAVQDPINDTMFSLNAGAIADLPAGAPLGTAIEAVGVSSPINSVAITGGTAGDAYEVICLPPPSGDVLICFDNGFSAAVGVTQKPIPRKFNPVDHYVNQRPDNKITLSELMVSNWKGLRRINGRAVTLVVKLVPGGVGPASEIQYYTNCRLTVPMDVPSDANESIVTNGEGTFSKNLFFAA